MPVPVSRMESCATVLTGVMFPGLLTSAADRGRTIGQVKRLAGSRLAGTPGVLKSPPSSTVRNCQMAFDEVVPCTWAEPPELAELPYSNTPQPDSCVPV